MKYSLSVQIGRGRRRGRRGGRDGAEGWAGKGAETGRQRAGQGRRRKPGQGRNNTEAKRRRRTQGQGGGFLLPSTARARAYRGGQALWLGPFGPGGAARLLPLDHMI